MRKACKFTEADLRRALRAAAKERVRARIDVMPDGRISIIPMAAANDAKATGLSDDFNEWDDIEL